jgi:hypothetical protein
MLAEAAEAHGVIVVAEVVMVVVVLAVVMEICGLAHRVTQALQILVAVVVAPFTMVMHQWLVELVDQVELVDLVW